MKSGAVIYLHGFASGVGSTKAQYFQKHLENAGYEVALPDLNVPTFEKMTISHQLAVVQALASSFKADTPLILMGSSLGGLLATIAASRLKHVKALILLAPGFGITERWRQLIGEEALEAWRTTGSKTYYHYAFHADRNLSYDFIEDLQKHEVDNLEVKIPTLVFHGIHDQTVPVENSRRFKALNGDRVILEELNDGHELIESLPLMWTKTTEFIDDTVRGAKQ
jgi:alpha-beta hydrolase superfamily lysophospholipase